MEEKSTPNGKEVGNGIELTNRFRIGQRVTYAEAGAIIIRLRVAAIGFIQDVEGQIRDICLVQKLDTPNDVRIEKFIFADELKPLEDDTDRNI